MSLNERVFGLETEYAINFFPAANKKSPDARVIVQTLQEVLFKDHGLPDSEFLICGAKFHHDLGHAEWAGPECLTAREAAIYDKGADHLLANAIPQAQLLLARKGYEGDLLMVKNNVDFEGNTYGCHENYMMLSNTDLLGGDNFLRYMTRCLVPFLVTRQIFAGAGRLIAPASPSERLTFEISQRSSFMNTIVSKETTKERPIVNLGREKEPLARGNYRRLHLILGDSNLSGWATWIKLGTMGILLRMIEDIYIGDIPLLTDPIAAIRSISRDLTCKRPLEIRGGTTINALEIQRHYFQLADTYLEEFGYSNEEALVMAAWGEALSDLEQDPMMLRDRADWTLKKRILDSYLDQIGISWEELSEPQNSTLSEKLLARDLRYHDIYGGEGSYNHFSYPDTLATEAEIMKAWNIPPQYTRARVRGEIIKQGRQHKHKVKVEEWHSITVDDKKLPLPDALAFSTTQHKIDFDKEWWTQCVMHEDLHVRTRAVQSLTWLKNSESLSMLINRAQNDESIQVRCAAIEAIGSQADQTTKDVLIALLSDKQDSRVRWAAQEALERVIQGVPMPPPIIAPATADEEESLVQIIS